jgi:uncharacterized protein (DUF1015 family)
MRRLGALEGVRRVWKSGRVPHFEPFTGLRYPPRVVRLDDVIAPPYDVIGSAERARLAARNPANSVLVELPEPDLSAGLDRYQVAARLFARWRDTALVKPDPNPSFYVYRMAPAGGRATTGVIGALELGPPGEESGILPHEQTLPKARTDRLDLLRATRANLSPIWGLSLAAGLSALIEPEGEPTAQAVDDEGVSHQLWVLDDPAALAAVTGAVGSRPVVLADGHHRYETALAYREEWRLAHGEGPGGQDLVLALVVELAEDQLTVGPTHRVLSGLPADTDVTEAFGAWFDVVRAGDPDERTVRALEATHTLALVTPAGAFMLHPRSEAYEAAASDLDSSLVALVLDRLGAASTEYPHGWEEAVGAIEKGEGEAAVLLRPVTVDQIAQWARARRRMPPKTTYFSPKPRTGMVFRSLD